MELYESLLYINIAEAMVFSQRDEHIDLVEENHRRLESIFDTRLEDFKKQILAEEDQQLKDDYYSCGSALDLARYIEDHGLEKAIEARRDGATFAMLTMDYRTELNWFARKNDSGEL